MQGERIKHTESPTMDELRRAIPEHCFQRSSIVSFGYLARDLFYASALVLWAMRIPSIQNTALRILAWIVYGFLQGLVGTGIWILAHECGHDAFSCSPALNNVLGWALHSSLLVPYFSWKITHSRHHRYTGHMEKDTAFVPITKEDFAEKHGVHTNAVGGLMQDTPVMTLVHLIGHQLVGWQLYLFLYETGGKCSIPVSQGDAAQIGSLSHFDPSSPIFTRKQRSVILLSDLGILIMAIIFFHLGRTLGYFNLVALYFVPYLWVHHWLVAITYLHHTHPKIPHYAAATWSFKRGALGTVDRSFGFIGRHFFHDIIDHHVIHHLFPRIPFYMAEEATAAIKPLLGASYIERKKENFLVSLWQTFRECHFLIMTYPTKAEILSIFGELAKAPVGYESFFTHVDDGVRWELTGQHALSGVWRSKAEFLSAVWRPIIELMAEPGPMLEVVFAESITTNEEGWTVVELQTKDTRTKVGHRLYSQHYCWLCKFHPTTKKIVEVRAFIDSSTAEAVLADEPRDDPTAIWSTGEPAYPPMTPFDLSLKRFLHSFYLLTDVAGEIEKYLQCFTPDALVLIGAREIRGREGIRALRTSMWETVKKRTHRPKQVFPYGPHAAAAMVYGTVDYVFHDDSLKSIDWAARCEFAIHGLDQVYLQCYQVFLAENLAWKKATVDL
ncbi:hypothetical protein N7462_009162 [Penicillium macrosclerotiorum]|uniref:uncharacterized protein n=1 Tax=Penicillium macrosclerotiorum TaxID=303699 RepID=UPI002547844E|nr:uncharacterized protein N7462_009162 [Penicillium macrosclerotiorum]KAJ5676265.1 hypothetical protein N7462_009162 [Penicillium macrosclerotiorum]